MFCIFALILGATILTAPLATYANHTRPKQYTQKGEVVGNGVRLRRTPGSVNKPADDILGLMYQPEEIWLDPQNVNNNFPAWCSAWRALTGHQGWMEWSFFVHS